MSAWESTDEVLAFLEGKGLLSPGDWCRIEPLTGGVSGRVWKIECPGGRWVVKQALPKLKVAADWFSDAARIEREQLAMTTLSPLLSPGQIPGIVAVDQEAHAYVMECAPEGSVNWKEQLMRKQFSEKTALEAGRLLRSLHEASRGLGENEKTAFRDLRYFRELRIEPFHHAVAARHPGLAAAIGRLEEELTEQGECFVHGDFSPKNLLIAEDNRPILLDYEVGHWGRPVYDVSFCIGHLLLKGMALGKERELLALIEAFVRGYGEVPERLLPHLGLMLLARVDGKSPAEYVRTEELKARIRDIGAAWLCRNENVDPMQEMKSVLRGEEAK